MIEKLRQNYKLTSVLIRIAFVITFLYADWQSGVTVCTTMLGEANPWMVCGSVLLAGVIAVLIIPFIINLLLNAAKIYSVPRAEYGVVTIGFFTLYNLILGTLNITNFFTPLFLIWGSYIFRFVASTVTFILFYKVTSKLYFNDVTTVHYFKMTAIVYFVTSALGVLL